MDNNHKDKELFDLLSGETRRQQEGLEMIASENYTSASVLEALGSSITNKYSEGYPGKRYYGGQEYTDKVESLAQQRGLQVFDLDPEQWHINVQPYSGSPANAEAYMALVKFGDVILGMKLTDGGHLTHGHPVSFSGKAFTAVQYGLTSDTQEIDYAQVEELALKHRPKIIVSGATAYPRQIDFERFQTIAKSVDAIHMADISHIAGLIAGGVHPSPFPYADIVTTTTHKTLRGPRGAAIYSRTAYSSAIDKAVFPGFQGGPHMNAIAAKAVAFQEALQPEFKEYTQQIIKNSKSLASALIERGFTLISGGTDNHLLLIDLSSANLTGKLFEETLEVIGISVNKNSIPGDKESPFVTSGVRVGTAAITTRGMKEGEMLKIAELFTQARDNIENIQILHKLREEVRSLSLSFPLPY